MLTIEELMLPRYKVIAPWPEMERWLAKVGDILTEYGSYETTRNQKGDAVPTFEWQTFPHLFKPLEWWEDRKPENMPEYIRNLADNHIFKVKEFKGDNNQAVEVYELKNIICHTGDFAPATEAEYLAYTNSLTTKQTEQ